MITVPDGTRIIINRSRYLSEALSKNLINHSALAKYIRPELESMLFKKISQGSIVMALKRLQIDIKPQKKRTAIFSKPPEILVRSGLSLATITRTKDSETVIGELFSTRAKGTFLSISIGSTEINIAVSSSLIEKIAKHIPQELLISSLTGVSLITIYLPEEAATTPGVYYFFLKSLAWEEINILGNATTRTEFTLFFDDRDVHRAFEVLSSLFTDRSFS